MVSQSGIENFRASLRCQSLCPGEPGYDAARGIHNATIERRPAIIARCAGAADVISCVRFAREHDLLVSVRGGGHSIAGKAVCDGGLMIDLSGMKGIRVDPAKRTVRAEPGLTLGEFACDNVISVDIVTTDGQLVIASATENDDLFWGVRGGNGNFGVVTSLEYRLHEIGPVLAGGVLYPIEKAREVLQFFREFARSCPDELSTQALTFEMPGLGPAVAIGGCYCGSITEGEKILRPLRTFGSPVADLFGVMPYVQLQSMFDAFFPPGRYDYTKANFLKSLTDEAIDVFGEYATAPSPYTFGVIEHLEGAFSRIGTKENAFPHRQHPYNFSIWASWADPADSEKNITWTRKFWEAMRPFMGAGAYVNYLEDEADPQGREAYGPSYERLVALKDKYDPTNFFRMNHNIKPSRPQPAASAA